MASEMMSVAPATSTATPAVASAEPTTATERGGAFQSTLNQALGEDHPSRPAPMRGRKPGSPAHDTTGETKDPAGEEKEENGEPSPAIVVPPDLAALLLQCLASELPVSGQTATAVTGTAVPTTHPALPTAPVLQANGDVLATVLAAATVQTGPSLLMDSTTPVAVAKQLEAGDPAPMVTPSPREAPAPALPLPEEGVPQRPAVKSFASALQDALPVAPPTEAKPERPTPAAVPATPETPQPVAGHAASPETPQPVAKPTAAPAAPEVMAAAVTAKEGGLTPLPSGTNDRKKPREDEHGAKPGIAESAKAPADATTTIVKEVKAALHQHLADDGTHAELAQHPPQAKPEQGQELPAATAPKEGLTPATTPANAKAAPAQEPVDQAARQHVHGAVPTIPAFERLVEKPATVHPAVLPKEVARDVVDQVIRGISLNIAEGAQEMRLTLKPESLGEVMVQVRMEDGRMQAQIDVTQPAVKAAIESQMVDLRQALQQKGIDVQRIDVVASSQSSLVGDGAHNPQGRSKHKGMKRQETEEVADPLQQGRSLGYNTLELIM